MTRVAIEPAAEPAVDLGESVEDPGLADFLAAGSDGSGEFRCAYCGYGAVVQHVLPPCPMCHSMVWERREPLAARFGY
jgi:hypothetical protein